MTDNSYCPDYDSRLLWYAVLRVRSPLKYPELFQSDSNEEPLNPDIEDQPNSHQSDQHITPGCQ